MRRAGAGRTAVQPALAITGMAGRFPGARTVDEFWRNLAAGVESVTFFSDEELREAGVPREHLENPAYVKAAAVLEGADLFDASFFGYNPREAEFLDPQQRLLLECAWEALEDAGQDPRRSEASIGIWAGCSMMSYYVNNLLPSARLASVGEYQTLVGNVSDFAATRVAYKLNLKGPSFTVLSACSSSLVAVHVACSALLAGQCDIAIAGGVSVRSPRKAGYFYREGMIMSPDGHCRAFDERAAGIIAGEGVGLLVLRRLEDATADGDRIHAVIRATAVNNDGAEKVGFTAPSVDGQAAVVLRALDQAGLDADSIGYIEAHGTATPLGDPIEIAALTRAFRRTTSRTGSCAVGSVKTNIGHLDAAAGIAGLIKAVLSLKHRQLPPSLHFTAPNPELRIHDSPFFINARLTPWESAGPRRAGVNSFGIGGTNAHVIVEEAPDAPAPAGSRPWQIYTLSARTAAGLEAACDNLRAFLEREPGTNAADAAYTLHVGRHGFDHRCFFVARDIHDLLSQMGRRREAPPETGVAGPDRPVVAFLFSGEDDTQAAVREHFAAQVATTRLLGEWGIIPNAAVAAGTGRVAALCAAGALTEEEGLAALAGAGAGGARQDPHGPAQRYPVYGADGLERVFQQAPAVLVQIGGGGELSRLAETHPGLPKRCPIVGTLPPGRPARGRPDDGEEYRSLLHCLGVLWLGGVDVDWHAFHRHEKRSRISLPTYPFERQRLWVSPPRAEGQDIAPGSAARDPDRARWTWVPSWKCIPARPPAASPSPIAVSWLVLAEDAGFSTRVVEELRDENARVVVVRPGLATEWTGSDELTVASASQSGWARLLGLLEEGPGIPERILHLMTLRDRKRAFPAAAAERFTTALQPGFYSLLRLAKALEAARHVTPRRLDVVVPAVHEITGDEALSPEHSPILGALRVLPQELPFLACRAVDVEIPGAGTEEEGRLAAAIVGELRSPATEPLVAFRRGLRWVQSFEPFPLGDASHPRLRPGGVYLITGGLGTLGQAFTRAIASAVRARIVLTGRTGLPPRGQWDAWLETRDADDPACRRIRFVRSVEETGSEVAVMEADAADPQQMRGVVRAIDEGGGRLDGIIHAAGSVGEGTMRTISEAQAADCEEQFHGKVAGLLVLDELLGDRPMDFRMMTSSLSSILGGTGFFAYAAANAMLDAHARSARRHGPPWLSVNWDAWTAAGPRAGRPLRPDGTSPRAGSPAGSLAELALNPDEGADILLRLLALEGVPQVAVSTGDLRSRLSLWVERPRREGASAQAPEAAGGGAGAGTESYHARPGLSTTFQAPRSRTERVLASIWQELLGIEAIGINDDFFELGGHSLLATQVLSRVRESFRVEVPLRLLFEAPTIAALAPRIEEEINAGSARPRGPGALAS